MNEKYLEKLGAAVIDVCKIDDVPALTVGLYINKVIQLLEKEEMRDLREAVNRSQGNAHDS